MKRALVITLIEYPITIPPMGSAVITACLNNAGYEAQDMMEFVKSGQNAYNIIIRAKEEKQSVGNIDELVGQIESYSPDVVGFSCYISNRTSTHEVSKKFKERNPDIPLIAGGPDIHPAMHDVSGMDVLKESMDYLLQGEGEGRIIQLLQAIENKKPVDDITGVYDCKNFEYDDLFSGYSKRLDNLDVVPVPDFGDNPRFERFKDEHGWWAGLPINISRGCTGNCSFCNRNEYFKTIKWRSAGHVHNEIITQMNRYGVKEFCIIDDDPLARPILPVFEELSHKLIDGGAPADMNIYNARLSKDLADPKWAKLFKRAGVSKIQFGVESFSPSVRKHMRKPIDQHYVDDILKNFSDSGINTGIYLIYGYANETEEDFKITLNWLKENGSEIETININNFILADPYMKKLPGTFRFIDKREGQPLSYWETDDVNVDIMWERYHRLKEVMLNEVNAWFSLADPNGNYIHGAKK